MESTETTPKLSFYDYHRQPYGDLPLPAGHAADFMIGDYDTNDGGVNEGGEFKIVLHQFDNTSGLHPQLCVFGDSIGSFREATRRGLLDQLSPVQSAEAFSRRLIGIGIWDRSATPLTA